MESSRRDLHNALLRTALQSFFLSKFAKNFDNFCRHFANFAKFLLHLNDISPEFHQILSNFAPLVKVSELLRASPRSAVRRRADAAHCGALLASNFERMPSAALRDLVCVLSAYVWQIHKHCVLITFPLVRRCK